MEYLYGSGLLFAAFLVLSVFRAISDRASAKGGEQRFGAAESTALFATAVSALGVVVILRKALGEWSLLGAGEMIAALAVLVVACIAASRALHRLLPHAAGTAGDRPINPTAPAGDRPARTGARRAARPRTKRAA